MTRRALAISCASKANSRLPTNRLLMVECMNLRRRESEPCWAGAQPRRKERKDGEGGEILHWRGRFTGSRTTLDEQAMWHYCHGHFDSLQCLRQCLVSCLHLDKTSDFSAFTQEIVFHCFILRYRTTFSPPSQTSQYMRCQSALGVCWRTSMKARL
jgi:hypothetical protein